MMLRYNPGDMRDKKPPEEIHMRKRSPVIKMNVDVTSYDNASQEILFWAQNKLSRYVCVANVHMCMETFDFLSFEHVVNQADLVVPDGRPLVWAQRLMGEKKATQVRGSDLLLHLCRGAEKQRISVGLFGGTKNSLNDFIRFLNIEFPELDIAFSLAPPFHPITPEENRDHVKKIIQSGAGLIFAGIGCPKQEKWMASQKGKIPCAMVGVGAAFDFFSGRKKHAPRWMQKAGLEWCFRLISDPKRLWKRYFCHNPRFIFYFLKQYLTTPKKTDSAY